MISLAVADQLATAAHPSLYSTLPQEMAPRDAAEWWSALPATDRQAWLHSHPAGLGAMDGLPAQVRHEANLQVLRADAASGHDRGNARGLLERVESAWSDPDVANIYLLGYQPPGPGNSPDAKVIASIANPDAADNVAVFVSGVGSDLANFGWSLDRMDDLRAQAGMIPGAGDTAAIVWLGYDAPDALMDGASLGYAREGAPALRDFTEGLREARTNPDARTTMIGYSYGSAVVGSADAMEGRGLAVDDIVAMGSAGMGYQDPSRRGWFDGPRIGHVGNLHIHASHFWAGASANDAVTWTRAHGNNPVNLSFGGQRISTAGASGHFQYWEPGSASLRNQAYIVTGNYDQVDTVGRRFG